MRIEHLVWEIHNEDKLLAHGIDPEEVEDLIDQDDYTVNRHREYPDQVRMTGNTSTGRWLTVALEDLGHGHYRPVTGWEATRRERQEYREQTP